MNMKHTLSILAVALLPLLSTAQEVASDKQLVGLDFFAIGDGTDIWHDSDLLWKQSPLAYADKVRTPTLFIHSDEDYRTPLPEGLQMYSALRYHGIPARIVIFKGENHELSRSGRPQNRIRRLQEITRWFDKYLAQ